MKNLSKNSPLVQLKLRKKSLNIELNSLKRQIIEQDSSERKKRGILKQINTVETKIEEIDTLIKKERQDLIKQYTSNTTEVEMLRTPVKQKGILKNATAEVGIRKPTEPSLDPDIIERHLRKIQHNHKKVVKKII